jgi:hypothetical protein
MLAPVKQQFSAAAKCLQIIVPSYLCASMPVVTLAVFLQAYNASSAVPVAVKPRAASINAASSCESLPALALPLPPLLLPPLLLLLRVLELLLRAALPAAAASASSWCSSSLAASVKTLDAASTCNAQMSQLSSVLSDTAAACMSFAQLNGSENICGAGTGQLRRCNASIAIWIPRLEREEAVCCCSGWLLRTASSRA